MSEPSKSWLADVFQRRYREVTPLAIVFGILIGIVMNASITYSGLKIGFTLGGSAIAAVLGWGVLRGIFRRGTIVENNIAQTAASSVNISNSGVIFTVPVLFLLGLENDVSWGWISAACVAGAILGVAFIIPTRKQMIDFERLRFPTGTAVAAVLRSPGEGVRKSVVLLTGIFIAMAVVFFTKSDAALGFPGFGALGEALGGGWLHAEDMNLGLILQNLGWRADMEFIWALAPFAIGAGYITGGPGLVVLAGGILAYHVITPVANAADWIPAAVSDEAAGGWARANMNRPLGIGMLMGGAMMGLVFAMPAIGAALSSMRRAEAGAGEREELPLKVLYFAVVGAFVLLFFAARSSVEGGGIGQALLIAGVGTGWMWFAGIVIAQCTGMTDWSPISGMALLTVMICLLLTGNQVIPAVMIGAAVCVAITLCADMMQDLKTGHMVGGLPMRQQFVEFLVVWIGPLVCIATVWLIAKANMSEFGVAFGGVSDAPAPQADALRGAIDSIRGGDSPTHLYAMGGIMGALLSLSGIAGLGVLVGLSMYLPLAYLLPYGLGCLIQLFVKKTKGTAWAENWGVPLAAGLIVGEGIVGVGFAAYEVLG